MSYYGTPQSGPPQDLPFLAPTAMNVAGSNRDSASTTPIPMPYADDINSTPTNSAPLLPHTGASYGDPNYGDPFPNSPYMRNKEEEAAFRDAERRYRPFYKRPWFWLATAAAIAVIVVAVVVPVVLVANKDNKNSHGSSAAANNGNGGGGTTSSGGNTTSTDPGKNSPHTNIATWGGDGSTVTKDDGTTFVYHNQFGGIWVSDPANPFNGSAKPNSWTPAISEKWTWGVDRIWGVNLGGLFVPEPFIIPSLFQAYPGSQDEWSLSQLISASTTAPNNLTQVLSDHYANFITEEDIAQIAGAGLNWVRLPIPFWAIETWQDVGEDNLSATGTGGTGPVAEPFLARVCWQYILRLLGWCRKYGIRVNLDLHTAPGSQNGYNHSGKVGQVNFLNGVMGLANAERMLDYIRVITEFISQPEWKDVVPIFSVINEALVKTIGQDAMTSFYLEAYNMIRGITGVGEGSGPFMFIHDGFQGLQTWYDFLPGSDRIGMDSHPYFAFDGQPNGEPIAVPMVGGDGTMAGGVWPLQACNSWASSFNGSRANFGVTIAGEFSNAINDCGLYIRGTQAGPETSAPCDIYNGWDTWNSTMKEGFMNYMLASMDALGDFFFWTWKIGNDTTTGKVQAPLWSYQLGLENGWMPTDPRKAQGFCKNTLGVSGSGAFDGTFQPWQTGGAGAGTIAASATAQFPFPPTSIAGVPAGQVTLLPTYTATRAVVTLPPPSYAPSASVTASVGNGWFDAQDTAQMVTAVSGCVYPDAWGAASSPMPTAACPATGAAAGAAAVTTAPAAVVPTTSAAGAVASASSSSDPAASTSLGVTPPLTARAW